MSWYRTGTINLTKDSASITGVNTKWAQAVNGVMPGMMMIMPDNKLYEIKNVVSDTSLVLVTTYTGATAAAQAYSVVTTYEGDLSQFSARFNALLTAMGGSRADMYNWLTSTAATISVAKDDGTTVTVKTLKAFTDEQAKFATKNANGLIPIEQGGTNAKDAKGIRENAGLRSAAEVDVGTEVGNIPVIVQRGHGRHISSMYVSSLSLATIAPGANEYMIAAVDPGADGINAVGLIGRFTYSRGGLTSNNMPGMVDVMIQASYKGLGATMGIRYPIAGARNIFIGTATATYKGRKVYLLKLPASGGPFDNGVFFDGVVFRTNDANDVFSVVKAEDLTDLVDVSNDPSISYPISSASSRKVGTDVNDIPYVGAFGVGNGVLNRPTAHVNQFISETVNPSTWTPSNGVGVQMSYANLRTAQIFITSAKEMYFRWNGTLPPMALNTEIPWIKIYNDQNTTKASDGALKAASPVARIADPDSTSRPDIDEDSFEWCGYGVANGEAHGIEITREAIGVYRVTGAKSLALSGWRLEPPKDPDGKGELGMVAAEQRSDEIIITLHRRKMTLENGEIVIQPGEPIDVPANSWIDVRLDMPEAAIPPEPEIPLETDEPLTQPEQ